MDKIAFIGNTIVLNSPKFKFKPKFTDCLSFKVGFLILCSKYGLKKQKDLKVILQKNRRKKKKKPVNETACMNIPGKNKRERKAD